MLKEEYRSISQKLWYAVIVTAYSFQLANIHLTIPATKHIADFVLHCLIMSQKWKYQYVVLCVEMKKTDGKDCR